MRIDNKPVTTLQQFYKLMALTREVRLGVVTRYLGDASVAPGDVASLETAAKILKAIPTGGNGAEVNLEGDRKISIDLSYEINELDKDILFLTDGESAFEKYLRQIHPTLDSQVEQGLAMLANIDLRNLITDRDGTVFHSGASS